MYAKDLCPILELPIRPQYYLILLNRFFRRLSPGKSHLNYDGVVNNWY